MGEAVATSRQALEALVQSLPVTFRCEADQGLKALRVQQVLGHLRLLEVPLSSPCPPGSRTAGANGKRSHLLELFVGESREGQGQARRRSSESKGIAINLQVHSQYGCFLLYVYPPAAESRSDSRLVCSCSDSRLVSLHSLVYPYPP